MTTAKFTKASRHKEGSRKAKVHDLFDKEGQDAAWTLGLKLKLAQSTLRAWFATWRREATPMKKKPTTKPATPQKTKIVTPPNQPDTISAILPV